jgi:hypothetical protein
MLSLLVWLIFGMIAVVPALKDLTWQTVLYAGNTPEWLIWAPTAIPVLTESPAKNRRSEIVRTNNNAPLVTLRDYKEC